jgi:hypothetical protein
MLTKIGVLYLAQLKEMVLVKQYALQEQHKSAIDCSFTIHVAIHGKPSR